MSFDSPPQRRYRLSLRAGFTLIEIIVVLVVIALLASIVTINVRGYLIRGRQTTARVEISNISNALETFYSINGRYPTNEEGISKLTEKSEGSESILTRIPIDPWGHSYQYNSPGRTDPFEVICFGADGKEGGQGANMDIISWDLREKNAAKSSQP